MLALFLTLPLLLFVKSPKFAIWAVEKSDLAEMETYYWCNHFREIFNCIGIKYHLPSFIIYGYKNPCNLVRKDRFKLAVRQLSS